MKSLSPPLLLLLSFLCLSSAQEMKHISLAVSDLAAQGLNESEAAIISEQLRVELSTYDKIRLIERTQMKEILKEQGFQQSGCTDDACAVEVGQLLGVKNMVIGSIGKAGSYTLLAVRVIDVATGEITVNEAIRTRGGVDKMLESGIRQIAGKLNQGLFPEESQKTSKRKHTLRNAFLFGGGAVVLAGAAASAIFYLNKDDNQNNTPSENTEIHLP